MMVREYEYDESLSLSLLLRVKNPNLQSSLTKLYIVFSKRVVA